MCGARGTDAGGDGEERVSVGDDTHNGTEGAPVKSRERPPHTHITPLYTQLSALLYTPLNLFYSILFGSSLSHSHSHSTLRV